MFLRRLAISPNRASFREPSHQWCVPHLEAGQVGSFDQEESGATVGASAVRITSPLEPYFHPVASTTGFEVGGVEFKELLELEREPSGSRLPETLALWRVGI